MCDAPNVGFAVIVGCASLLSFHVHAQKNQDGMPDPITATEFGYASATEALAALKKRPEVGISIREGWTIAADPKNFTTWTFTPLAHPASPAAIKRTVARDSAGNMGMVMAVKCGGTKLACDKLVAEFTAMNERARDEIRAKQKGK